MVVVHYFHFENVVEVPVEVRFVVVVVYVTPGYSNTLLYSRVLLDVLVDSCKFNLNCILIY